jgi:CHAT domain-containing protein/tetratricopeptide (TPR) repeat protein
MPEKFERAKQLVAHWHLGRGKELLEDLSTSNPDADVLRCYADVLRKSGEFLKADSVYRWLKSKTALSVSDSVGLAFTQYFLGRLMEARIIAHQVAGRADQTHDLAVKSRMLNLLGLIAFNEAKYDEALQYQEESLSAARLAHSVQREADALRQLGVLAWYRGQLDTALVKYYQPALDLYRLCDDKIGEATTLSNIGLVYQDRRRWEDELKYQLQAFEIRKRIGDLHGQADSYYFLSTSGYLSKGKTFAYAYRMKSLELSTRIGYAWGREVAARSLEDLWREQPVFSSQMGSFRDSVFQLTGEGKLYLKWHEARKAKFERRWNESAELYGEVIRLCDSLKYEIGRRVALWESGRAFMAAHRYTEAEKNLIRCRREFMGEKVVPMIDIELGEIYVRTRRPGEAKNILIPLRRRDDSLYSNITGAKADPTALDKNLGQIFQNRFREYALLVAAAGQEGARTQQIFELIEQERRFPFWGERRWSENETGSSIIGELIRLLEDVDQHPEEFAKTQHLVRQVGELQQLIAPEQAMATSVSMRPGQAAHVSIQALQSVMGEDEVFVEYFIGFEEVLVFAARKGNMDLLKLSVKPEELRSVAGTLREAIVRGKDNGNDDIWKPTASLLYRMLLQPLLDRTLIHPGSRLIISPHLFLSEVPFQALLDEQQRPSLMNFTISYVPSASMLAKIRNEKGDRTRAIIAFAPVESSLPFTRQEIQTIREKPIGSKKVFESSDATAERLLQSLESSSIVHVASHARINRRFPFYSHIQCADRRLELHEILRRPVSASLVFLSSCETGETVGAVSDELTSESVVSFPQALLIGGASNVVASLWLVGDKTTSSLVAHFYDNLAKGSPATPRFAESLTRAQRQLIEELRLSGKNHPFYWAPFLLVGDGR